MEITKVREICYVKAREHGFNLYCPITVNTRFRKTLGRVCYDEYGELEKIEFSAQLLEYGTEKCIVDTILHELAHAFVYLYWCDTCHFDKPLFQVARCYPARRCRTLYYFI